MPKKSKTHIDEIFNTYSSQKVHLHQPYFIMGNKLNGPWPSPLTEGKRVIINKISKYQTSFLLNCAGVVIWEEAGNSILFYHLSNSAITSYEYKMLSDNRVFKNAAKARVLIVSSLDSDNLEDSLQYDLIKPLIKCGFQEKNIVVFSNFSGYLGISNSELGRP
ncbi:MAG: hypothetical protein GY730_06285 [bacterium]|nr:hypothetical protein [bacterium]